jgi:hypothetical protein
MSDASTGHSRSQTYAGAAGTARVSAARFDDHAATAHSEARKIADLPDMAAARADFVTEGRKADAAAEDRRSLAKGFDALSSLEGRD